MEYNSPTITFLKVVIGGSYSTAMDFENHFLRGVALSVVTSLLLAVIYGLYFSFKNYFNFFIYGVLAILFIEVMYALGFIAKLFFGQ